MWLMRRDEFLDEVRRRGGLETRAEAELAVRATLQALGPHLSEPIADNLAALLPRDIGESLRSDGAPDDFIADLSRRAGVPAERAETLAAVVLGVVDDATDGTARAHLLPTVPGVPEPQSRYGPHP